MFLEPLFEIEEIILLGPKHASEGLAQHARGVLADVGRDGVVEFIRLTAARSHGFIESATEHGGFRAGLGAGFGVGVGQSQADDSSFAGRYLQEIMGRGFGAGVGRIDGFLAAIDDVVVDRVLNMGTVVGRAGNAGGIGFVFGEKQGWLIFAVKKAFAQITLEGGDDFGSPARRHLRQ